MHFDDFLSFQKQKKPHQKAVSLDQATHPGLSPIQKNPPSIINICPGLPNLARVTNLKLPCLNPFKTIFESAAAPPL